MDRSRREVTDAGAIVARHVGPDAPLVPSKRRALFEEFEARFAQDAGPLHRILQFRKDNEGTSPLDGIEVVKHQNIVRIIDHAVHGLAGHPAGFMQIPYGIVDLPPSVILFNAVQDE